MNGGRAFLRLVLDAAPPLALAICSVVLAVQYLQGSEDPSLQRIVFVGAAIEFCGALLDALLAESLAERLGMRLLGWIAAQLLVGGVVVAAALHVRQFEPAAMLLLLAFMASRFVSFVLMPPRDELERRRIKALARDRLESLFALITVLPLAAAVAVVLVQVVAVESRLVIVSMGFGLLAAWLLLLAVSAAVVNAPTFARRPQRLLTRGRVWKWLTLPGKSKRKGRSMHEDWRREEARWLSEAAR